MTERHSLSFAPCSVSALSLREGHADGNGRPSGLRSVARRAALGSVAKCCSKKCFLRDKRPLDAHATYRSHQRIVRTLEPGAVVPFLILTERERLAIVEPGKRKFEVLIYGPNWSALGCVPAEQSKIETLSRNSRLEQRIRLIFLHRRSASCARLARRARCF